MADTPNATAGDVPARVNQNGTVDTGGREAWVWCEDDTTRHRFDLPSRALPKKGVSVVEGYPLNFKRFARREKTRQDLAGDPVETDVHGDVDEKPAPEAPVSGDQQHADQVDQDAADAAAPVEQPAPEVASSGDDQHAETADATDAQRVEAIAGGDTSEAGAGDAVAAPTTKKNGRAAR